MSFYGSSIIFDGAPSERFGLMMANMDGAGREAGKIGGTLSIVEDRIARRHDSLHYGVTQNEPLSFSITLIVADSGRYLDRYELAAISAWLTGHQQYKELIVCQEDMSGVFYRCLVTELEPIEVGSRHVGVRFTVTCDAPYAYLRRPDSSVVCADTAKYTYHNQSNLNDYYYPQITFTCVKAALSLTNESDGGVFTLSGMSTEEKTIVLDCKNLILTSSDAANLYNHWNKDIEKTFPRFLRGDNELKVTGQCTMTIRNEFPWSVGC